MRCYETGECFGQISPRTKERTNQCYVLAKTYPDTECPFKKPKREITNGVYYPTRKILDKAGVYEIYE